MKRKRPSETRHVRKKNGGKLNERQSKVLHKNGVNANITIGFSTGSKSNFAVGVAESAKKLPWFNNGGFAQFVVIGSNETDFPCDD